MNNKELLDSFVLDKQTQLINLLEKYHVKYKRTSTCIWSKVGGRRIEESSIVLRGLEIRFYAGKFLEAIWFLEQEYPQELDQEIYDWLQSTTYASIYKNE